LPERSRNLGVVTAAQTNSYRDGTVKDRLTIAAAAFCAHLGINPVQLPVAAKTASVWAGKQCVVIRKSTPGLPGDFTVGKPSPHAKDIKLYNG